jgi:ABC-type sugar transport system ATPase subunit
VTALRDGSLVGTRRIDEVDRAALIRMMVGRDLAAVFPKVETEIGEVVLEARGVGCRRLGVRDASFDVRRGEIVGLAGLVGAGRTEIVRAIAGADVASGGTVAIDGQSVTVRSPHAGIAAGIAFITEDRKAQGLVLGMTVRENTTLAHLATYSRGPFVDRAAEVAVTDSEIAELRIRTPSSEQIVRNLSGGNQQKVVLAKWLTGDARVFLFDEPTRGVDVGAKAEIYALMLQLLARGAAIVMVSSELPEVLGMSHRILVVRGGRIAAEFARADATPDAVIAAAAGVAA